MDGPLDEENDSDVSQPITEHYSVIIFSLLLKQRVVLRRLVQPVTVGDGFPEENYGSKHEMMFIPTGVLLGLVPRVRVLVLVEWLQEEMLLFETCSELETHRMGLLIL